MPCGCGADIDIKNCQPFANKHDVENVLKSLCGECVGFVPAGTSSADYLTVGFPNGVGECCQQYIVYDTNGNIFNSRDGVNWCQSCGATNIIDDVCTAVVPAGTATADFIDVGFGGDVNEGCQQLTVIVDDGSGIYVNVVGTATWNNLLDGRATPKFAHVSNASPPTLATPSIATRTLDTVVEDDHGLSDGTGFTIPNDSIVQVSYRLTSTDADQQHKSIVDFQCLVGTIGTYNLKSTFSSSAGDSAYSTNTLTIEVEAGTQIRMRALSNVAGTNASSEHATILVWEL